MKKAAIICECNPPHFGHEYIIRRIPEISGSDTCVIAIMSGNFVQRAEPAIIDKYSRAEALLYCGADLVVELPFPWSSASAEYFADAGTTIAEHLRSERLFFGATTEDLNLYSQYSLLSDSSKLNYANAKYKPAGYAAFYRSFLEEKKSNIEIDFLDSLHPNDILAIAYLNSIRKNKLSLVPIPVKRVSSLNGHNLETASQLRDNLRSSGFVSLKNSLSENVFAILKRETERSHVPSIDRFYNLVLAKYRLSFAPSSYTAESGGGVHELLMKAAMRSCSGEEMLSLAATKKYTNTRLRRAALYFLLEIYEECLHDSPAYTLLLAANEKGRKYLSASRRNNDFSILTKPSASNDLSDRAKAQYLLLQRADNLYALCLEKCLPGAEYLRRSPTIL